MDKKIRAMLFINTVKNEELEEVKNKKKKN